MDSMPSRYGSVCVVASSTVLGAFARVNRDYLFTNAFSYTLDALYWIKFSAEIFPFVLFRKKWFESEPVNEDMCPWMPLVAWEVSKAFRLDEISGCLWLSFAGIEYSLLHAKVRVLLCCLQINYFWAIRHAYPIWNLYRPAHLCFYSYGQQMTSRSYRGVCLAFSPCHLISNYFNEMHR